MTPLSSFTRRVFYGSLLLVGAGRAWAQAPVITSVSPAANSAAAGPGSVTVTFSQPLTAASAAALRVFSSQRGGLRTAGATPAVVTGNTVSFAPTAYPFKPGETVQYSVTTAAASASGALATARVGRFTTAVGGTGNGNFQVGSTPGAGSQPTRVLLTDLDGDGDLDFISNLLNNSLLDIGRNNGSGTFSGSGGSSISQYLAIPNPANSIAVADVDGDGDLDLIAANASSTSPGAVSVRLNDGTGNFSGGQDLVVYGPSSLAPGDVDGDGDIDIVVGNGTSGPTPVSILLNNGTGTFSSGQLVAMSGSAGLSLGDLDNDGDLDLVAGNSSLGTLSVRLNSGNGTFGGGSNTPIFTSLVGLVLGDVDGDNDLDLVVANYSGDVSAMFNTGNGTFSGNSFTFMGGGYTGIISGGLTSLTLGDVDGDGDLDVAGTNTYFTSSSLPPGKVGIRLNNGHGTFSGGPDVDVAFNPQGVTMGDADGDGDLDLLIASATTNPGRITVLLNRPGLVTAAPPATPGLGFTVFPNPAHAEVTVAGVAAYAPLTLLDPLGRVLLTATADAAGTARLAGAEQLPAGVYLVRSGTMVRRLVVE